MMGAGRTKSVDQHLLAPFRRAAPTLHVVPAPPGLQSLGLVPSDDKSASGQKLLPL